MLGNSGEMTKAKIEATYAEAFTGLFCRLIVTADDYETLRKAAEDSTATPSVVVGRTEGGVERYLTKKETPDRRLGSGKRTALCALAAANYLRRKERLGRQE